LKTPGTYGYINGDIVPTGDIFIFDVMACSDAHIALSSDLFYPAGKTYEVIIGAVDNTQ
jgi:hypothetical protein